MNIIYKQQNGQLAVIIPTKEISIEEVAKKDLPPNTPYKIVESLNIDNTFFNATWGTQHW